MPRLIPLQTSFAAGEVSFPIYSRPDIQKYFSGAQIIENYLNLPQGGVQRRPGLHYVATAKDSTIRTIVRPFIFSATQAYILEIGVGYIRFYKSNARLEWTDANMKTPVELSTPYTAAQLYNLDFVQSADVLYFLHSAVAPNKLLRYGDTCWRGQAVTFTPPPSVEYGTRPAGALQVSAIEGDNVTVDSLIEQSFFVSDVNREIIVTAGVNAGARLGIKSYTNRRQVVGTICDRFVNLTATCTGSWKITGSPLTTCQPAAKDPVGATTSLTLGAAGWRGFEPLDTTLSTDSDCGKFVLVHGGEFEITSLASTAVANVIIRGTASAVTAVPKGAWSLEESLWSALQTYPETGDFFDDRLYLNAAHRLAGSKSGDYENFGLGVLDDDAVVFAINSKSINTIRAIVGARKLHIFTTSGEYIATGGGIDDTITPTNIRIGSETTYGSGGVTPIRVADATIFLTRSGKQLREFTIRADSVSDVFVAPDLLLLAQHLTADTTIVDLAYQHEPDSRIWAVRNDGTLLCCAYRREENIVAWSRHTTCGQFESVAVIPHPDGDREQVWVSTVRTINGATKRFIEYLDDCTFYYPTLHLDAAMTCNTGSAITTVGVGDYLANQGVKVVADGVVLADTTVGATGRITLSAPATRIEVGLPYISTVTTLRPEATIEGHTSQTSKLRWAELFVKVLKTIGITVGTDSDTTRKDISFDANCGLMDIRLTHLGWDCGVVTVQQRQPLPSTILMISGILDLGGA